MRRVAITGMGAVCGLGHNLNDVWNGIIAGKSGISKITPGVLDGPVEIAGEVKNFILHEQALPAKEVSRYDKFLHYALAGSYEAYHHANLTKDSYPAERIGCILGVGMGGIPEVERVKDVFNAKGHRRVSPFFIPAIIPNMASGLVSIQLNLQGLNYTIASACASAGHAIGNAATEIMLGRQDVVISGGSESVICDLPVSGFNNMKALSRRYDEPEKASRPFDLARDGFVIGEGAGVLVLEDLEKAKARGATIYAEVVGFGASSDAHHITAPHPNGDGAYHCMQQAMTMAGIGPQQIDYINAHGTSTPLGDIAEIKAIKRAFQEHAKTLKVSSTKSMTGHLLGAAAGIETIFCAMALHTGIIPPTANLEQQDPLCDLDCVANKAVHQQIAYALNNSFGFGGTNSSTILKAYKK